MGSLEQATAVCPVEACVLPRNSNMMMILFVGSGVGCCGSLVHTLPVGVSMFSSTGS